MTDPSNPRHDLNADQFDNAGLPGIDPEYPPDQPWAIDTNADDVADADPDEPNDRAVDPPLLMDPESGDPAVDGDTDDTVGELLAEVGEADPDAPIAAEEAAIHIIEE